MKLTIERAALLRSLSHISSVVERRNTIPILGNVRLVAEGATLKLTATDMDLEVVETCPALVEQAGETTTPAHTLHDIVRKLPDGSQVELSLSGGDGMITVRAGRSQFRLGCLPVADFPVLHSGDLSTHFKVSAGDLGALIARTRFAISTEETRYYLNGIYFHTTSDPENPMLRAVATDGHRLARVELPAPVGAEQMPGIILPRKAVTEIAKLLEDETMEVSVSLGKTKARFEIGDVTLTTKLIDGTFPDYERVIPTGNNKHLRVPTKAFAAAVDRVATIAIEKTRAIKMSIGTGSLILSATSPEAGSATEELEVDYAEGGQEIGFNSRYLLDITQQVTGEELELQMADSASPTIVKDANDGSALYVLMPMRV